MGELNPVHHSWQAHKRSRSRSHVQPPPRIQQHASRGCWPPGAAAAPHKRPGVSCVHGMKCSKRNRKQDEHPYSPLLPPACGRSLHHQIVTCIAFPRLLFVHDIDNRPISTMAPGQDRPVLSPQQTAQYLDRLQIPEDQRIYDVAALKPEHAYQYLALLQKHQLVQVPFENLTLHYSPHRQISLHPEQLFKKIIGDNNGRGGYCMENNGLFGMLLRSLGFKLFSAGARVFDDDIWHGW